MNEPGCDLNLDEEDEEILDGVWKQIQEQGWESIGAKPPSEDDAQFANDAWKDQPRDYHGRWGDGPSVAYHAELVKHTMNVFDRALTRHEDIPNPTKAIMRTAFRKLLICMSPNAIKTFQARCLGIVMYKDTVAVTDAYRMTGQYVRPGQRVGAFVTTESRALNSTLHINAGGTDKSQVFRAQHYYAHEVGHVIDFGGVISSSGPWMEAWNAELKHLKDDKGRPSYSAKNRREGFAEFYRAVVMAPEVAKEFKLCWAVLKKHNLIQES